MLYPQYFIDELEARIDSSRAARFNGLTEQPLKPKPRRTLKRPFVPLTNPYHAVNHVAMRSQRMNLLRILFIAILLLAFGGGVNSQERPKSTLVDEFGETSWEDYVARIDHLINEVSARPNDVAYIIIENGPVRTGRDRFRYEQWAKGQFKARAFDPARISLIRAKDGTELRIQFWLVPPGADKPRYYETDWSLQVPVGTRAFIWTTSEWNNELATPPEHLSLGLFAETLKDNPGARAHFVIKAGSNAQFSEEQTRIRDILVDQYGIASQRLKFFYVRQRSQRSYGPSTEVWLIPEKIR